jgi:hypothetical protein
LQIVQRFRAQAVFCAVAVVVCELISRPFANMGICDDGPYILIAQKLAATGHIVYNGWETAMLGWQLYLAAAFIKLFGFSFTTVRMSTLLVAMALAFVLQRTMVRLDMSERNATFGTLTLVLSPLYLMLSVTFMSDISGLFAVVICLYACLRALQSFTSRATLGWLCFAVLTNAIFGTARQIAWLGVLVIVPSTLWLLRGQRERRVLAVGAFVTIAGTLFIFGCMHWFKQQPYTLPEPIIPKTFPISHTLSQLCNTYLGIPFLILPMFALFIPEIRKSAPRVIAALFLGYLFIAVHPRHTHDVFLLEPTNPDWVSVYGIHIGVALNGTTPLFLHKSAQILLTVVSFGGLIGLIASLIRTRRLPPAKDSFVPVPWRTLKILLVPFTAAYVLLLIPRATDWLFDRYMLGLLGIAVIFLVRYYQERVHPQIPFASFVLVAIMAVYGIALTHNMFAFYRARVVLAAEVRASGVPDTSVDNGWEYNYLVDLQHGNSINDPRIEVPAHNFIWTPRFPGTCHLWGETTHIDPIYGVSFDPNECYGPAPFAPVPYSRWLASTPGTLYVVRYTKASTP